MPKIFQNIFLLFRKACILFLGPDFSIFGDNLPNFQDFGAKLDFEASPTQSPNSWAIAAPPVKVREKKGTKKEEKWPKRKRKSKSIHQ